MKNGNLVPFGNDEKSKHCLKKIGTKYVFTINNPQPEDAGFYQVDVDETNVLTTDFQGNITKSVQAECAGIIHQGLFHMIKLFITLQIPLSFFFKCLPWSSQTNWRMWRPSKPRTPSSSASCRRPSTVSRGRRTTRHSKAGRNMR